MPTLAPTPKDLGDPGSPDSWQLHDLFDRAFPFNSPSELLLRERNTDFPVAGLLPCVETGEITQAQWLLYTATCLNGQISNGGFDQFLGNCPGLVMDADEMLALLAPSELVIAYQDAAGPTMTVIRAARERGEGGTHRTELHTLWQDLKASEGHDNTAVFEKINQWIFKMDDNPPNPAGVYVSAVLRELKLNLNELFC